MHKEIGILDEAGKHYLAAAALTPDDADLQIQLGHYYKVTDRLDDALAAYRRATELDPQDEDAKAQLAAATRMRAAPDFANASPRTALLARARLRSEAGEFLRNAPADQFDAVAANIRDSRRFYLLDGIEQRFPDPSLGKDSVVACIALCLEADAKQAAFRIVDAVLGASPDLSVPLSLLWRCLDPGRAEASASVQAPLTVQLATLSVAANILARQRAIIDRLAPTP